MKNLAIVLSLCFCFGILSAQSDTIRSGGATVVHDTVYNVLLYYSGGGISYTLADEIIFSGSYDYHWNEYDSTLTVLGHDIGIGVGDFMPVTSTLIKYKIQNGSIEETNRFYYSYSQYGLSPYRLNLSQNGELQVLNKNGVVMKKNTTELTYQDFKFFLNYLTKNTP